jgi:hypothetical protein
MATLSISMVAALVVGDAVAMRAAPEPGAPRQAVLWRGDWLEVRGHRRDFVQVYDHRRERPGFVHESLLRSYPVRAASAERLRAVVDFLRDRPGSESLGIGYLALYMKVAAPADLDGFVFDALGTMARRLALRASTGKAARSTAAHLDVAASYGVVFGSLEEEGRTRICYDGRAFHQVLAVKATAAQRTRAALALTDPRCQRRGPAPRVLAARALHRWALAVLDRADPSAAPPHLGNRLRLRRSHAAATYAFELARRGQLDRASRLSRRALKEYLRVDRAQLAHADRATLERVALRVAAVRWARARPRRPASGGHVIRLAPGRAGETCVHLLPNKKDKQEDKPVITRCTYGQVWLSSVRRSQRGDQVAVAVQHLAGWVEAWIFHKARSGWVVDVLVPAAAEPTLGYVEVAGWTPDGKRLLVVREAEVEGSIRRRFQALRSSTLAVVAESRSWRRVRAFRRWHTASWRRGTLALR